VTHYRERVREKGFNIEIEAAMEGKTFAV
jgi:hypothetical protein